MAARWHAWMLFGLLGVVLLGWLWPLLAGETLFWGLPTLQFYPWRAYAFAELRAGHLPLWNPYNGGGAPLLANYQTAVLYPPNWLHLILPDVTAMNLLAVAHIVWAAAGVWRFTGRLGMPDFGRAVSALAFSLSGYLVARLGSFPTVAAAAWLPWLFWAADRARDGGAGRVAGLALIAALQLLAGHAQTTYYTLLGLAGYVVWIGGRLQRKDRWRLWARVAGGLLLGFGLAAAQLFPTAELYARSVRADGLHYEWTTNFSYAVERALTLLAPNLYGTPADGSYLTEGAYFEDAAYMGLLPLVAALSAVGWRVSRQAIPEGGWLRRDVPFWTGMAIVAFLIALGRNGFLFPLLYRYVPTFQAFQGPVRWLILFVFPASLLAGMGVSYSWGRGPRPVFWNRLFLAAGCAMIVMGGIAVRWLVPVDSPLQVMGRAVIGLGTVSAGCAVLALLRPIEKSSRCGALWEMTVLIFIAADLFWAFRGLNPTVPAEFFAPRPAAVDAPMLYMPQALQQRLMYEEFFDFRDYRRAVERWPELRAASLPNLNLLDRQPMFNNFEPLVTQTYAEAVSAVEARYAGDSVVVLGKNAYVTQEPFGEQAFATGVLISGGSMAACLALWGRDRVRIARLARPDNSDARMSGSAG
ncbi:MAG: hypothetical protein HPY64_12455 [Anaerolineae bacterium]|nr:hypothetical protein [Anaerolineae bacterium]